MVYRHNNQLTVVANEPNRESSFWKRKGFFNDFLRHHFFYGTVGNGSALF